MCNFSPVFIMRIMFPEVVGYIGVRKFNWVDQLHKKKPFLRYRIQLFLISLKHLIYINIFYINI